MTDILSKIVNTKHTEVADAQQHKPLAFLYNEIANQSPTRGFAQAILKRVAQQQSAVIAEIKKASPSKGVLRELFEPNEIAISYEAGGATCLSVLTDQTYFKGHSDDLKQARLACQLPILRKDFIIDEYQIIEARAMGADAILLIAACLSGVQMQQFERIALQLGMDTLVEVHNQQELEKALLLDTPLLGINNRNLSTFEVSLNNTINLLPYIPKTKCIVTESGIHTINDIHLMRQHAVYAFLVGEVFMRHSDPSTALRTLFAK
jgi:indole-3-glycerol phosphate synthase